MPSEAPLATPILQRASLLANVPASLTSHGSSGSMSTVFQDVEAQPGNQASNSLGEGLGIASSSPGSPEEIASPVRLDEVQHSSRCVRPTVSTPGETSQHLQGPRRILWRISSKKHGVDVQGWLESLCLLSVLLQRGRKRDNNSENLSIPTNHPSTPQACEPRWSPGAEACGSCVVVFCIAWIHKQLVAGVPLSEERRAGCLLESEKAASIK